MKTVVLVLFVLAIVLSSASAFSATLMAKYTFDGNANDSVGNANGATFGGCTWPTGWVGSSAIGMDGVNGYVQLPQGLVSSLTNFSITAWVYLNAQPWWMRVFDFGSGTGSYMCLAPNPSETRFIIKSPNEIFVNGPALPIGRWRHVAITQSGTTVTMYMGGVQVAQANNFTTNPSSLGSTTQTWLGRSQWTADPYLNGKIDDFRIYNGALTAAEVKAVYDENPQPTATINGVVRLPDGATPATSAKVALTSGATVVQAPTAVDAVTGAFTIANIEPGVTYTLRASAPGYAAAKVVLTPAAGTTIQNLTLAVLPPAPIEPVIDINASDATPSSWVNHGVYGGAFVPVTGTPNVAVAAAGPAGDMRNSVTFSGSQWLHLMNGATPITANEWITGAAPHTVIAWLYDPAPANNTQGQRDVYFSWAPMHPPVNGGMYLGLGWKDWGGAVACADCGTSPWINWPGNNADFATAMTNMAANNSPYGKWVQIATVYDGTGYKVYQNTVERTEMAKTFANNIASDDYQIYLGGSANGTNPDARWGDSPYIGSIGRLKMYARALSAGEVAGDYINPPPSMSNVTGFVQKSDGTPLVGATIRLLGASGAVLTSTTSVAPDGAFTASGWTAVPYTLKATLAGYSPAYQSITLPYAGSVTVKLAKKNIARESDLLFGVSTSDLPESGAVDTWPAIPANPILTEGAPTVATIDGMKWEQNLYTTGDGFLFARDAVDSIPCNGATVVMAVKPVRNTVQNGYNSLVSVFINQLEVGIRNSTGALRISRGGESFEDATSPIIPDGQATILSLVVQPTGEFKVYANGSKIWEKTNTFAFTRFSRDGAWYMRDISLGRAFRNDGWSTSNAYIGSTYVYKTALNPSELAQMQAEVGRDLGITRTITGKVVTSGNVGVEGASIMLNGVDSGILTGAGGTYTANVPLFNNTYQVSASKLNYQESSLVSLPVVNGTTNYSIANIVMDPYSSLLKISGTVTDVTTHTGAANVKLVISSPSMATPYTVTTDSNGHYSVDVLGGNEYVVDIDNAQTPKVVLLTPLADRWTGVDGLQGDWDVPLSVAFTSTLAGKVVTTDATAPSGYAITAKDATGAVIASATTGADGIFKLVVTPVGQVTVAAHKRGYVTMPAPQTRNVSAGNTTYTIGDFTASPGGTISGTLRNAATGLPVFNGVVQSGGLGDPAMVTDATGAYSLQATGCGGAEVYGDAINYRGKTMLVTDGVGGLYRKDIALTPEAEPLGYDGNMEDLVGNQPAQWSFNGATAGTIDWSASSVARTGSKSLFYTTTATPKEYDGIVKILPLTPGYNYNFYYTAKADPEVFRWQPMVEFQNADASIWDGFVSNEPVPHREWAHDPYYDWHTEFNWMDRAGKLAGPPVRYTPPAGATEVHFIFLFEADTRNNINGNTTGLPIAGKGCYIDDLVFDAVPAVLPQETVASDSVGIPVAGLAALKTQADGTAVILAGPVTVIYAPTDASNARTTTFFYIGEKQGLGGLQVRCAAGDSLKLGDKLTNLVGVFHRPSGAEPYLQLSVAPTGVAGTAIRPVGINNKVAAADAKAKTNAVKVWGKVVYSAGANTFTVSDGYGAAITVNVNGVTVPDNFNGKTAVVTGVLGMDGVIQAQQIAGF